MEDTRDTSAKKLALTQKLLTAVIYLRQEIRVWYAVDM